MAHHGFIDLHLDQLADLLRAVTTAFASEPIRIALWLIDTFDFTQFAAVPLTGSASPFSGSNSQLAGFGYLLSVEPATIATLIEVLTSEEQLDCNIMHLEIEVADRVAIASYDTFNCVFFNDPVTLTFLETLKQQDIINDYGLCDPPK